MSDKKTILFGPLPPPYGGVSTFMKALSAYAAADGFRVWSYKGRPESDGVFVDHRRFGHIAALLREGRGARIIDSTHFHLEYPNSLLLPLWLAGKRLLRFKWIKVLHDGSLPLRFEHFGSSERKLFRSALKGIDEFVVAGSDLEKWLRDELNVKRKISFIRPLLPVTWSDEPLNDDLAEKLGRFSRFEKRVCSIGTFTNSYGFHEITNAVETLRNRSGLNIGLFLIDGGVESEEKFRREILRERDWIVTAADVPHPNLANVFRASDCFVRGFAHESYGLARVEAILSGTPVIATDIGETRGMSVYRFGDMTGLIANLERVLAGTRDDSETKEWAGMFRAEAARNLEKYRRLIRGDEEI